MVQEHKVLNHKSRPKSQKKKKPVELATTNIFFLNNDRCSHSPRLTFWVVLQSGYIICLIFGEK